MDTYTVRKGDTLGAIAKRFGVTVADLVKFNKGLIKDPNRIQIGWELKLQDAPPPPPPKESGGPIKGLGGKGFALNFDSTGKPDEIKDINPFSKFSRPASAVLKEKNFREGSEIKPEVKTPVEIAVIQPAPPPPPPEPPVPFAKTTLGRAHSFLDPVQVLAGRAGDPNFKATINDNLATALTGFGAGLKPAATLPFATAARALEARPVGQGSPLIPESAVSAPVDIRPTAAQMRRLQTAIRSRTRGGNEFDPGFDDLGGQPNVRSEHPFEPTLPTDGRAGPAPKGARERTVDTPEPLVVRASDMKTVDDWRGALRSAADNTVVVDGASDLGFVADRVIIVRGTGGKRLDPEKVLDSFDTPVLSQQMFARVLKHIGFK